jgi:hypothetical protein
LSKLDEINEFSSVAAQNTLSKFGLSQRSMLATCNYFSKPDTARESLIRRVDVLFSAKPASKATNSRLGK